MPVYRNIQVNFWQDPFVLKLTPEQKFFYIYLMTNPKTTQCGIYEISKIEMSMETGYNNETIEKLLKIFIDHGKIKYSEETDEIMLVNWIKYNKSDSPKVKACILKELENVKNKEFVELFYTLCIEYGYSIERLPEKEKEVEKEFKKELKTNTCTSTNVEPLISSNQKTNESKKKNDEIIEIMNFYNEQFRGLWKKPLLLTKDRKAHIRQRLETFTIDELKEAIVNLRASPFHCGENDKGQIYGTPEFLFRNDSQVDKWLNQKTKGGGNNGRRAEQYTPEYYDEPQYTNLREKRPAR